MGINKEAIFESFACQKCAEKDMAERRKNGKLHETS